MFKIKKYNSTVLLSALLTLGLVGCDDDDDDDPAPAPSLDIVETAVADGRFETLVAAVTEANLVDTLQSPGPFTVFAPTDDAFGLYLDANDLAAADLLAAENLGDILTYHVLGSEVNAAAATDLAGDNGEFANTTATVNGKKVALSVNEGELYINTAKVIVPDVGASNGVIHALDRVLDVPKDVPANFGVACSEDESLESIAVIASKNPALSTLYSAVTGGNADSVATLLSGNANLTVFAPTNDAFGAVNSADLDAILADSAVLINLLQNHVFGGGAVDAVGAYSLNGLTVDAAGDAKLSFLIDPTSRSLKVNDATVVITDIYACNGIVHVIDAVL
jgi:uncharacterized surface protein with fasciclin (FAS1) repeats